jgi:hypothetical protein
MASTVPTNEYNLAMVAFLRPQAIHPLDQSPRYISAQLTYAECSRPFGPNNKEASSEVRMAALEVGPNYKHLSIFSTNHSSKDVESLMKIMYESRAPLVNFQEYVLGNELSDEEIYKLASILVGRACQSLGYYVPKELSRTTTACALCLLHTIMVDRRSVLVVPPAPQAPKLTRPRCRPYIPPAIVVPRKSWSDDGESDTESEPDLEKPSAYPARVGGHYITKPCSTD